MLQCRPSQLPFVYEKRIFKEKKAKNNNYKKCSKKKEFDNIYIIISYMVGKKMIPNLYICQILLSFTVGNNNIEDLENQLCTSISSKESSTYLLACEGRHYSKLICQKSHARNFLIILPFCELGL